MIKFLNRVRRPQDSPLWALVSAIHAHHGRLDFKCLADLKALAAGEQFNRGGAEFSINSTQFKYSYDAFAAENALPDALFSKPDSSSFQDTEIARMLYTRMLFSALVDADYSASAEHFEAEYLEKTDVPPIDAKAAIKALEGYRKKLKNKIESGGEQMMNRIRETLFLDCLRAGTQSSGLFTLTAPTGPEKRLLCLLLPCRRLRNKANKES
jgi:hypothetical protein